LGKAYTYLRLQMSYCQALTCFEFSPCPIHQDSERDVSGEDYLTVLKAFLGQDAAALVVSYLQEGSRFRSAEDFTDAYEDFPEAYEFEEEKKNVPVELVDEALPEPAAKVKRQTSVGRNLAKELHRCGMDLPRNVVLQIVDVSGPVTELGLTLRGITGDFRVLIDRDYPFSPPHIFAPLSFLQEGIPQWIDRTTCEVLLMPSSDWKPIYPLSLVILWLLIRLASPQEYDEFQFVLPKKVSEALELLAAYQHALPSASDPPEIFDATPAADN